MADIKIPPRNPYKRVTRGGYTLNARTDVMLDIAEHRLGAPLRILQGSYNAGGVTASGGTHDGGGAVDCWCDNANVTPQDVQRALRSVGFAAWYRTPIPNLWGAHVHAEALGDKEASPAAKAQWVNYKNRTNGLVGQAPDPTWHPDPIVEFQYKKYRREQIVASLKAQVRALLHTATSPQKVRKAKNDLGGQ